MILPGLGLSKPAIIAIIVAVIVAAIGGAIWRINDAAFARGQAETRKAVIDEIARQKQATDKNRRETENMTEDEIDEWLRKKCRQAGGSDQQCG